MEFAMKRIFVMIALGAVATGATLPLGAMPIGMRTAAWSVSAANAHAALSAALPEELSSAEEMSQKLAAFSDESVAANIADEEEYSDFREWALESGARVDTLTNSPTVYLSFATGSSGLLPMPEEGDLVVEEVMPLVDDGKVEMVFSLENVTVDKAALEARLKAVFGVIGAAALDETKFSDANLAVILTPTDDGKVKATITPKKDTNGNTPETFFMKVKMK